MTDASPQVHIVVVNWNAGDLLRRCVESVARWSGPELAKLVVVDNGSTDGSADLPLPDLRKFEVRKLGYNAGFAAGCNIGARDAQAGYLLFLNPDTEFREPVLSCLVTFMESADAADVGICGIRLVDEQGQAQRSCSRLPDWHDLVAQALGLPQIFPRLSPPIMMTDFDHLTDRNVGQVIGAFFFVRHDLFRSLGGFDEDYFVYFEDLDFAFRAAQRGFKSRYVAGPCAYHKGGGTSDQVRAHRLFYSLRSRILYAYKHFSRQRARIVAITTLLVEPLTRLARGLLRRSVDEIRATLSGFKMLFGDLSNIRRRIRRKNQIDRLP